MTWQPIETAPKGGQPFIGLCDGLVFKVKRATYIVYESQPNGSSRDLGKRRYGWSAEEFGRTVPVRITGWMPLPEPPE